MLVNLDPAFDPAEAQRALVELGLWVRPLRDESGSVRSLEIIDRSPAIDRRALLDLPGVRDVLAPKSAHPLVDAQRHKSVTVRGVDFGGAKPVLLRRLMPPAQVTALTQPWPSPWARITRLKRLYGSPCARARILRCTWE